MKDEQGAGYTPSGDSVSGAVADSPILLRPSPLPQGRPTWAEINLDHLAHNFRLVKRAVGAAVAVMPAVKADAYGHGAVACALALERLGADWFGVALPEEGEALRAAGVTRPVLCLGGFWEGQEAALLAAQLTPVLYRLDLLERLDRAARRLGRVAAYHLKVDTGMGRLGVPRAELAGFLDRAARFTHLELEGVMTHFASADLPDKDEFTRQQMTRFESALAEIKARGHRPAWIHEANSAASLAYPLSRGNLVRPGGVLYGLWRDVVNPQTPPLDWRAVLALRTRIIHLKTVAPATPLGYGGTFTTERESRIATLAIGYEDGLPRALSNRGRVLVRGGFAPLVGRVSMDLTLIDVTDIKGAALNDEVTVIGAQGGREISAEEVAAQVGTISYEITCRLSERVPRVVVGSQWPVASG
ncbi:MAG TPA: alanine racemase [Blastocatellia bacterium]|nr:alanine racemase [Blastocatellia bacterium]